jgi:hypothetical protein
MPERVNARGISLRRADPSPGNCILIINATLDEVEVKSPAADHNGLIALDAVVNTKESNDAQHHR